MKEKLKIYKKYNIYKQIDINIKKAYIFKYKT